ncbi:MAG: hypothetical protein ACYCVG_08520, partial [Leptospirillum sp.]
WNLRERLKKQEEEKQNRPLDPLLPCGLRRGMLGQMFMIENGRVRNLSGRLPAWALTTIPERYLKRQRGPEL